jgi:predicted membrane metal-binding protein
MGRNIIRGSDQAIGHQIGEMRAVQARMVRLMKPANQVYLGKISQTRLINKWQMIPIRVRLEHERQRTPPPPPASYSYRLTLFLDFLGFKERVDRTVEDDGALRQRCAKSQHYGQRYKRKTLERDYGRFRARDKSRS